MRASLVTVAAFLLALGCTPAFANPNWDAVGQALGKPGALLSRGAVYRVAFPRSDLKVTLDGVVLKPALALGSWLAFQDMGDDAMVMGDLVLTEDEVDPVMQRLIAGGIDITALHNHLLRSQPTTLYLHISGRGDPLKLAAELHAALALSKTPLGQASTAGSPQTVDLDTAALDTTIGYTGKANGGVYQFTIPRAETITDGGMTIPVTMGTGIAINFQPTGSGQAAITGDFVLIVGGLGDFRHDAKSQTSYGAASHRSPRAIWGRSTRWSRLEASSRSPSWNASGERCGAPAAGGSRRKRSRSTWRRTENRWLAIRLTRSFHFS
jgi:hypothetical protein